MFTCRSNADHCDQARRYDADERDDRKVAEFPKGPGQAEERLDSRANHAPDYYACRVVDDCVHCDQKGERMACTDKDQEENLCGAEADIRVE